jgi:hypothetical protein
MLNGGAPGGFYRVGEGAHALGDGGQWWLAVLALKA